MATWSIISPASHPLASIDNNGKVTFGRHSVTTNYRIQYSNDPDCTSASIKDVIVYACDEDCSYLVTSSGNKVSSAVTSNEYIVGIVTTAPTCAGSWSFEHVSGVDFLTGFRVANGYVYASVKAANDSSSDRSAKYKAIYTPSSSSVIINDPMNFGVVQQGKGSSPASDCPNIGTPAIRVLKPSGSTASTEIIQLTGADSSITACSIASNVSWIQDLSFVGRGSGVYSIMGTYTANTSGSVRYAELSIVKTYSNCGSFGISQFPNT